MFEVKNLSVSAGEKKIIEKINLSIKDSEILVLFGPNGSGKSTLIKTIMGFSGYQISSGEILFDNKKLNELSVDERVKMGIGIMYQHPPKIRGVRLSQIAGFLTKDEGRINSLARELSLESHLEREINLDFSGGEMKRSELFQILLQKPRLLLLDEPESGVDVENISNMGRVLNNYLKESKSSALIITHTGYILDYIDANRACVMIDGGMWCYGKPREIFESIKNDGYIKCKECKCPSSF